MVAAKALLDANFQCEVDPVHATFISQTRNKPYVEAHHLVPFARQCEFAVSLDVLANVVALCPLCHKLLHHATPAAKREILGQLFDQRKAKLEGKQIRVTRQELLGFYSRDLPEEEG
ncbi:HNH endonuclease [Chitiniphilus purpureus]|uniref:HNH endonuclease n=1 Tax=Chitiniphilus purpureus TaxID=2981137 RepID=UPI002FDDFBE8